MVKGAHHDAVLLLVDPCHTSSAFGTWRHPGRRASVGRVDSCQALFRFRFQVVIRRQCSGHPGLLACHHGRADLGEGRRLQVSIDLIRKGRNSERNDQGALHCGIALVNDVVYVLVILVVIK